MKLPRCPVNGKHSYSSLEWAAKAALHASKHRGGAYRPYDDCPCGYWHITKNPGTRYVPTVPGPFTPADMARLAGRREEIS